VAQDETVAPYSCVLGQKCSSVLLCHDRCLIGCSRALMMCFSPRFYQGLLEARALCIERQALRAPEDLVFHATIGRRSALSPE
jgi:hypothetical protein